jgi:hypothetical protein
MKAVQCNRGQSQRQGLCFQIGRDSTIRLSTLEGACEAGGFRRESEAENRRAAGRSLSVARGA